MPELTDVVEGPASFFRRITKGVSDSVSRPHTGSTRAAGAPEVAQSVSNGTSTGNTSLNNNNNSSSTSAPKYYRLEQFNNILDGENVDLTQLRKLSWNGVPPQYRTMVWQLLLEYMPTNKRYFSISFNLLQIERFFSHLMKLIILILHIFDSQIRFNLRVRS